MFIDRALLLESKLRQERDNHVAPHGALKDSLGTENYKYSAPPELKTLDYREAVPGDPQSSNTSFRFERRKSASFFENTSGGFILMTL